MPVCRNLLIGELLALETADQGTELDISMHAVPAIVLLIDLLLLSPPWTITVLPALGLSGGIAFGYWFWVERCFQHNGWCVTIYLFTADV